MVYLDGDNDLEKFAVDDFLELSSVGSTSDVNIIVQFDRGKPTNPTKDDKRYDDWTNSKRYKVTQGMTPTIANALEDIGEVDMADPQVLFEFLNWSANKYEAKKYFLVIWNHGLGWEGIVKDDSSGGFMKTPELAEALEQFYASKSKKIDVIAFDACRMMIEMIYEMRNYAHYFVGSSFFWCPCVGIVAVRVSYCCSERSPIIKPKLSNFQSV